MPRTIGARCGVKSTSAAEDLLHLGGVAVGQQPVGREVLVDRPEVQRLLEAAAGARDARGGVDDDARRLDQAGPHQRGQGQPGRRRVATRPRRRAWRRPGRRGTARAARRPPRPAAPVRRAPRRTSAGRARRPAAGSRPPGPRPARPAPRSSGTIRWDSPWGRRAEHQVEAVETRPGRSPRRPGRDRRRPATACARRPSRRRGSGPWPPPPRTRGARPAGAAAQTRCTPTPRGSLPSSHEYTSICIFMRTSGCRVQCAPPGDPWLRTGSFFRHRCSGRCRCVTPYVSAEPRRFCQNRCPGNPDEALPRVGCAIRAGKQIETRSAWPESPLRKGSSGSPTTRPSSRGCSGAAAPPAGRCSSPAGWSAPSACTRAPRTPSCRRTGTIHTWTYCHVPLFGKKDADVAGYGVAQVDLPEGPRVQSILSGGPRRLRHRHGGGDRPRDAAPEQRRRRRRDLPLPPGP